jgi:hypothetical protein
MTRLSRRSFLGGSVALAGASACPISISADNKQMLEARRFVEAVGICTHPNWRDTVWATADWESALLRTGVKYTRGKIGSGPAARAALSDLRPLFARGVKICVTVPETRAGHFDLPATKAALDFLANEVGAQNLCGIESANEFNNPSRRTANWAGDLRRFQHWLHDQVRATRAFDDVPLIAPSIWRRLPQDYHALGNLEPHVDRGCLHYYTGGRRPTVTAIPSRGVEGGRGIERSLRQSIADARSVAPNKPIWATEYGYAQRGPGADANANISEVAAAKYLIRGLFDMVGEGLEKVFIYALIDNAQQSSRRYHGLLDQALNPRLSFHALARLMRLFADDADRSHVLPVEVVISGGAPSLKHWHFSKKNGESLLVMYQDIESYDLRSGRDVVVPSLPIRLVFAKPVRNVEVFTPASKVAAHEVRRSVESLIIPVTDDVTVVQVSP